MLFKLIRNPAHDIEQSSVIPYERLEVLAIVPRGLQKLTKKDIESGWAKYLCSNWYICRTEEGLQQVPEQDVWAALESGELMEAEG